MFGIFGNLFDFSCDDELNILEQATEIAFLDMLINEEEDEDDN